MKTPVINLSETASEPISSVSPLTPGLAELSVLIERFAKLEGVTKTAIHGVRLYRADRPTSGTYTIYEPAVCIIAQGQKQAMLGNERYCYNSTHYLVGAVDVPVMGQVLEASSNKPYLAFHMALEPQLISELLLAGGMAGDKVRLSSPVRGLFVSKVNTELLAAVIRLIRLLETPADIPVLAPLIMREIVYRLLQDEHGITIAQIALANSHTQQMTKVINILKRDYSKNLRIDELAREVCMSSSSLHAHFKTVTNMTPLQYQKQLRLQEARRLLLAEQLDAATASHRVGYESPSQFNREYHRLFGLPPLRDIARLRASNVVLG